MRKTSPRATGPPGRWPGERRRGNSTFHATAEWFGAVQPFDVLDAETFAGDTAATRLVGRLRQEARSVVNIGLGFQRNVSERFSYYGAFTTDRTFTDQSAPAANSLSTWDIYHVTAGTSLQVRDVKFTLGVAYAFGGDSRPTSVIVTPPEAPPALGETPVDMNGRPERHAGADLQTERQYLQIDSKLDALVTADLAKAIPVVR